MGSVRSNVVVGSVSCSIRCPHEPRTIDFTLKALTTHFARELGDALFPVKFDGH